jgi:hypothetical protein
MDQNILISGRDTLLVAIPLVLMMFISVFRLDQIIAKPKVSLSRHRPACGVDEFGEPILCDPDGRQSGTRRRSRARK